MNKTNSRILPKRKRYILILLILAVLGGHFFVQMSFIESETQLVKIVPAITPDNQIQATVKDSIDIIEAPKPLETAPSQQPVKIVQREVKLPAPKAKVSPKQSKNEPLSARLRRAEKLLTGF